MRKSGTTVVVPFNVKADDKAGTSALKMGEELIIPEIRLLQGAKGGGAIFAYRVLNGMLVNILPASVVELLPMKLDHMWVSFRGVSLEDHLTLSECGVRTDDEVYMELTMPSIPNILTVMRKPGEPGKAKGKGKGKGGGGKKKK